MNDKTRISFDLDEVLFVSPETHETEPPLSFPLNKIYVERLRKGTPELIHTLQNQGFEAWVYTSSFRTIRYIRNYFRFYGIHFDDIINGTRHLKEVQRSRTMLLPQKMPSWYRISLHIDDEPVICAAGQQYGFRTYHLDEQDDEWVEKIIARANEIRNQQNS